MASTPSGPYLNTRIFQFLFRGHRKRLFDKKNYNVRYFSLLKRQKRPKNMLAQQVWIRIHSILHPDSFTFASRFIQSESRIWVQFLRRQTENEAKNHTWKKFHFFYRIEKNLSRSALRISMITLQRAPSSSKYNISQTFFYWIRKTVVKSLLVIDVADEAAGGFAWWQLLRSGLAQLQGPLQHAKI